MSPRRAAACASPPIAAISRRRCSRSTRKSTSPDRRARAPCRSPISTSALRGKTSRSRKRAAMASISCRSAPAKSSPQCARKTCPACVRLTTRSASAGRSNIRSPASPWRCGATAIGSRICASPSPAPIRGRCGSPGPLRSAAAASTSACLPASTLWCAIRSWR